MTPKHIEMHRKRFEELLAYSPASYRLDKSGNYIKPRIRYYFQGYLLCAENLEVTLPEVESDGSAPSVNYHDLVDKLESQGIKVNT